jgi:hypothetical protein
MGSEQAGLTGAKGSIVRKVAVGRSVSNLQDALTTIRSTLEGKAIGFLRLQSINLDGLMLTKEKP